MKRCQKYFSLLLLAVFSLAILPAPALHEWFADHTDAAENHCRFYHKDLGRHIEEQQNHCDIFKTNTPVYDALAIHVDFRLFSVIGHAYDTGVISSGSFSPVLHLPSRAPPVA